MKWLILPLILFSLVTTHADESISVEKLKALANADNLIENLRAGDKVFVYFWASWCPECREKLSGDLQRLQANYPKFKFITVNADRDPAKGLLFAESEKLKLPIYRDDDKSLTKSLKLFAVPAWAVLEKSQAGTWQARMASTGADLASIEIELRK